MYLVFEILYFFTDKICKYRVLSKLNTAIIDRMQNWYQPFADILYALRRMSEICNLQALRTLKFVLIYSYISHGISDTSKHILNNYNILKSQNKENRIMIRLKQK